MRLCNLFFGAWVLLCSLTVHSEELRLKNEVVVNSNVVILGDLFEETLPSDISEVIITARPRSGKVLTIKPDYIERYFIDRGYTNYKIIKSSGVKVRSLNQILDKEIITNFITKYIRDRYKNEYGRLKVSVELEKEITVPVGKVEYTVKRISPNKLRESNNIWISLSVAEQYYQTIKVHVRSEYFQLWPFSKVNISKFSRIREKDIQYKVTNSLLFSSLPLNIESNKWRARKTIKANQVILDSSVEKMPLVNVGDMFSGQLQSGLVTISVKLKALEKGFLGNRIRAQRLRSDEVLLVTIKLDKYEKIFGVIE